ncbi:MAG: PilZ domain-containing protein [Alteromonadales bacterium]|nr:PilZ domain-containing protein [Alteromonadales bacterium]
MTSTQLEQKLTQYNEFFSIEHNFTINIVPLKSTSGITYQQFINAMPMPFKLASDIVTIDQAALRPLQGLSGVAGQLVEFLNHQSQKIDLLVGYILSQQDDMQHRYQGIEFGGGGVKFKAERAFELGEVLEMKIFLLENNCAVFCYGEVIAVNDKGNEFQHRVIFHFIREEDREVLVRTSLHEQSKQLQILSQQRNNDSKNNDQG